ncbi:hypothetical protein EYS14_00215 [Alteromonadaceae bacterium M269]|nr:hypothetical protein EYS14_00215 [Alteromonadaceae bacterium M269]
MRVLTATLILLAVTFVSNADDFREDKTITLAEQFTVQSTIMGDKRSISVSLPDGYDSGKHSYPVVYLLDGEQNLYHAAGTRNVLTRSGDIPPVILVGLTSVNRSLDMTPSKVADNELSGGANKLLSYIQKEVIPFVEKRYRTNNFRILSGHSLGGLFTTHALFEKPELFDAYIIVSPSYWWNNRELINRSKSFFSSEYALNRKLFFGIGENDGYGMQQELIGFVDEVKKSQRTGLEWQHRVFPNEGHMSAQLLVFYQGIKFIFSDMHLPQKIRNQFTIDGFLAHERSIQKKYGSAARQSQEVYVTTGFTLMEKGLYEEAVAIFKRNAEAYEENRYPTNNIWLAEAYEKSGAKAEALNEYRKAYELALEIGDTNISRYKEKILALGSD